MNAPPRLGQRVRFIRDDNPIVSPGRGGMIEQLGPDGQFFVLTDCGGFFGWTTFASWGLTDEPDVPLDPEFVALRTPDPGRARGPCQGRCIMKQESTELDPSASPVPLREDVDARLISANEIWALSLSASSLNELVRYGAVATIFVEIDFDQYSEALLRLVQFTQVIKRHVPRLSHPVLVVIPPDFAPAREVRDAIVRGGGLPFFAPKTYAVTADKIARLRSLYSCLQQLRASVTDRMPRESSLSKVLKESDLLAEINSEDE